jgi:alkylhydroperoxidase family enzyme
MARLRPLGRDEVDHEIGEICDAAQRETGSSASARTLAHHPSVVKALNAFRAALAKESVLEPTLKELVRLKIANRNACRY